MWIEMNIYITIHTIAKSAYGYIILLDATSRTIFQQNILLETAKNFSWGIAPAFWKVEQLGYITSDVNIYVVI